MTKNIYFLTLFILLIFAGQYLIGKNSRNELIVNTNSISLQPLSQDSTEVGAENYNSNNNILKQNYPNPFNPSTTISFNLPERSYVELNVYNVLGVRLATLIQGVKDAGLYSVQFNASKYPSGLYIYELQTNKFKLTRKMIYMK